MSTVNSSYANGLYYSLSGQSGSTASTEPLSLAQMLGQNSGTSSDSSLGAYTLDLSPAAQSYLSTGNLPSVVTTQGDSFTLSDKQQQEIAAILAKYKDAPQTQDTFNQIQDDLTAAHLGPDQLALQDKIKSFNATQVLIDALAGKSSDLATSSVTPDSDEDTKSSNYMKQIIAQWKSISTAGTDGTTAAASDTTSAGAA